jgi:hypothetical protein
MLLKIVFSEMVGSIGSNGTQVALVATITDKLN